MPVVGTGGSAGTSGRALGWEWRLIWNGSAVPASRPSLRTRRNDKSNGSKTSSTLRLLPDARGERGGVVAGERVHDVNGPARRSRAGLVFRVSRGCSVCRGDFGDGGPGGGVVDEVLAGAGGGDQGGGADVVDGSGLAAGGLVDLGDRVVGEQLGGPPGLLQVMPDIARGLVRGHALHLVSHGDPLLQRC